MLWSVITLEGAISVEVAVTVLKTETEYRACSDVDVLIVRI